MRSDTVLPFIVFVLVSAFGFCQEISGSPLQSAPPSLWVLRGDGKVLTQPSPPPLREEIIVDLPGLSVDAVPLTMVRIPAGSFVMGRHVYCNEVNPYYELPLHTVTFSQDFLLGKYEITKAQWQALMGTTPWEGQSSVSSASDSPAVWISWNDVQTFIAALNELGQGTFRLPSEAEWEYACRAGTTTRFYWGNDWHEELIGQYAWWIGNTYGAEAYAHEVGHKLPNAWGLYDMSGNVNEFCQDYFHNGYDGAPTDGSAWETDPMEALFRSVRGGHWNTYSFDLRSARRGGLTPDYRIDAVGFRVVRTP